jgi:hypothetical protein
MGRATARVVRCKGLVTAGLELQLPGNRLSTQALPKTINCVGEGLLFLLKQNRLEPKGEVLKW